MSDNLENRGTGIDAAPRDAYEIAESTSSKDL
jgi:hypothetical protein